MEQTVNLYQQLVNNLKNALDQNFKNQLFKEKKIETFDPQWKSARQNIERYLRQIASQNIGFETVLLSDRFFLYEDVAALLVDLLWQETQEMGWEEGQKLSLKFDEETKANSIEPFVKMDIDIGEWDREILEYLVGESCDRDVPVNEIINESLEKMINKND